MEQQQQQQQFRYQSHPYQNQHQQFSDWNNLNIQGQLSTSSRRLTLPRLDTSSPAVRPTKPRFYANFQLSTPVSISASATTSIPPSPSATSQTSFKGLLHRASFSPSPDLDSARTSSSSRRQLPLAVTRPTSTAAVSTPATSPSSSESAFPKRMEIIDSTPSRPKVAKYRTFFGGIVSSTHKEGRVGKGQKSIPSLPDGGAVPHLRKELKRSQSMFALIGGLVRRGQ